MRESKYRTGTKAAMDKAAKKLNLPFEHWMQDWPYEVVDASDIEKYIDHYKASSDDDEKFVFMKAIIQATEDQPDDLAFSRYLNHVTSILIDNFRIHEYTIYDWSCFEVEDVGECWKISKKMREVWQIATSNSRE